MDTAHNQYDTLDYNGYLGIVLSDVTGFVERPTALPIVPYHEHDIHRMLA